MKRRMGACQGYSLLELLVYLTVLAIGINLFVSALGTGSRLSATTTLQMGRLEGIREVQQTFVHYVRRAADVVPSIGRYNTGDSVVVLKMPALQPEGFDYLVVGAVQRPDAFTVLGLTQTDGQWQETYMKTLRQALGEQSYVIREDGARPLIQMTVQVKQESGERERPFLLHTCNATPRSYGSVTP